MAKSTVTLASLDDIDQLFSTDVPKGMANNLASLCCGRMLPTCHSLCPRAPGAGDAAGASTSASAPPTSPMTSFLGERPSYADMKMDEPVLTTIMRDMYGPRADCGNNMQECRLCPCADGFHSAE